MGQGVNDAGADAKARERAGAGHESNLGNIMKITVVFG